MKDKKNKIKKLKILLNDLSYMQNHCLEIIEKLKSNCECEEETMKLISNGLRTSFSDSEGRSAQGKQMAAATVVLAPLLVMFVCLRKYIMRGVSRSGIKG